MIYNSKKVVFSVLVILSIVLILLSILLFFRRKENEWGKHKYLEVKTTNTGNNDITRTKVILGTQTCEPWLISSNNSKTSLLSNNEIPESAIVCWKNKEDDRSFTQEVNLWEIVPKDIEGEYLTLIFKINSDTNEVTVAYKTYNLSE